MSDFRIYRHFDKDYCYGKSHVIIIEFMFNDKKYSSGALITKPSELRFTYHFAKLAILKMAKDLFINPNL